MLVLFISCSEEEDYVISIEESCDLVYDLDDRYYDIFVSVERSMFKDFSPDYSDSLSLNDISSSYLIDRNKILSNLIYTADRLSLKEEVIYDPNNLPCQTFEKAFFYGEKKENSINSRIEIFMDSFLGSFNEIISKEISFENSEEKISYILSASYGQLLLLKDEKEYKIL